MKKTHMAVLLALGALAAAPLAEATYQSNHDPGSKSQKCKKPTKKKAFVVKGTLDALVPGTDPMVDITVTRANRHARNSGLVVKGDPYMVNGATDPGGFNLKLSGYEASEDPEAGDKVRIKGKIPVTKKKCPTSNGRYGEPDIKRVKVIDKD